MENSNLQKDGKVLIFRMSFVDKYGRYHNYGKPIPMWVSAE